MNRTDLIEKEAVAQELESILSSACFRASKRSKEFLSYVVRHELEKNQEPLKERTIGVDLFARPAGYATGDDPVVRVQAGDVRRRLEQYYRGAPHQPAVRIELPVGSYTPEFIWSQVEPHTKEISEDELPVERIPSPTLRKNRRFIWAVGGFGVLLAVALTWMAVYRGSAPKSNLVRFWSPAFNSSAPIMVCLAKPMVYRPSVDA